MKHVSVMSLVVVVLVACGAFVGCGYQWKPLSECAQQTDCPQSQRCVRQVCTVVSTAGACTTNADCINGAACVAQRCATPTPENPGDALADGGPGDRRTPPDAPGLDAAPDARPDAGPDTKAPDTQPEVAPETTPEGTPDITHESPQGPVQGCLTGSNRGCLYKKGNQPKACSMGTQVCLFDGSWSACKGGGPVTPTGWYTPAEYSGEFCGDDEDNNCNGVLDEGCYDVFDTRCQKSFVLNHTPLKANVLHPAFLSTEAYSPRRELLLQHGTTSGVLAIYAVNVTKATKQWLFDLPAVGSSISSYDLSADGSYVAASTGKQVIVWKLAYTTSSNVPQISHFGIFPVAASMVGFRNVDQQLVIYASQYDANKRELNHDFSTWQLRLNARGGLELSLVGKATPQKGTTSESFSFHNQSRVGIHPGGGYVVFHSYNYILAYSLPKMILLLQKKLTFPPDPEARRLAFHPKRPFFVIAPFNYGLHALTVDMALDANGKPKGTSLNMYEWAGGDAQHMGFDPTTGELYASRAGFAMTRWPDVAQGQTSSPTPVLRAAVSYALLPNQDLLLVGTSPAGVRLISTTNGKELLLWDVGKLDLKNYTSVSMLRLAADGKTLFVVNQDSLSLWSVSTTPGAYKATLLQTLVQGQKRVYGSQAAFSKDGKWLVWTDKQTLHVWKQGTDLKWTKLGPLTGHTATVSSVAFHPTKPLLLSGDGNGELRLWSFDNGITSRLVHSFVDTKQSKLPLKGVGFYEVSQKADDTFILATTRDGTTHALSLVTPAQGALKVELLPDVLPLTFKGTLHKVKYDASGAIAFAYGDGGGRLKFQFSAPDAKGQRKLMPAGGVQDLTPIDTKYSVEMKIFWQRSGRFFALINQEQAFFWRCK